MAAAFYYSGYNLPVEEEEQNSQRSYRKKKKVNKGRWTKDEDDHLKDIVLELGTDDWKAIADNFQDRTDVQCLHRWQKVLNPELVKGPWTKEEDEKVVELVEKYGPKRWSLISQHLQGRIGKQCRERWHNHLNPHIRKCAWTEEEDRLIYNAHKTMGNKWAEIAKLLPGRTDNAIKNHWNSTMRRKVESGGYEHYRQNRYNSSMVEPSKRHHGRTLSAKKEKRKREEHLDHIYSYNNNRVFPTHSTSAASVSSTQTHSAGTAWSQHNSTSYDTKIPSHSHNTRLHSTPKKTNSRTDSGSNQPELISPFRSLIDHLPDSLLEHDPTNWGDVSTFEKGATARNLQFTKLTSPGATGYRFDGNSLAGLQTAGEGSLIPITSPVIQTRFSTPPTILRRSRKRKAGDKDDSATSSSTLIETPFSPKGSTPIKSLPFSPSQFLNTPAGSESKVVTSTPADTRTAPAENVTLHTPVDRDTSSAEDPFRTPRIRRSLLTMSPRTPTPFKNALKVLNQTKMATTPSHFEEDFSEIIKREEEESGFQISYSESKKTLGRNVRTSLDEKYDSIDRSDAVSQALYDNNESVQQENPSSPVPGVVNKDSVNTDDSGIVHTSLLTSPTKSGTTVVKTSEVFGNKDAFATPTTSASQQAVVSGNNAQTTGVKTFLSPGDVEAPLGQKNKRKGNPMRLLRFQDTPTKPSPTKLDATWEQVACGKTPDQQLLTEQARQFITNYRPAARTLQFSTAV